YNVHQVAEEVTHLNLVSEHYLSLSPEKIATAQRVVIESDRLDLLHNPNLNTDYDKVRDGIHIFMGMLLDWFLLPNSRMECDAAVKTLAHNALQTFLDLESKHHYAYDDIRPKGCPPSLTDEKYLQALRGKLKELIAQGPHTLGIEMGTGLQTVSHKGKRRASDSEFYSWLFGDMLNGVINLQGSTSDKGRRTKDFRD
ncbi:hypothetical protein H0H93_003235, partial [Arthromyces matolae]